MNGEDCELPETKLRSDLYCPEEWNCQLQDTHCSNRLPNCVENSDFEKRAHILLYYGITANTPIGAGV